MNTNIKKITTEERFRMMELRKFENIERKITPGLRFLIS